MDLTAVVKDLILLLSVSFLYILMLLLGRRLKRSHGVRLNWSYQLFSLCLAIYLPAKFFDQRFKLEVWGREIAFRRELGAVMCLLGALFLVALVDRYIWDLYFRQKHRVKIPRFLSEIVTLVIIAISVIVVLEMGYGLTIKGLVIGPSVLAVIVGLAMQDLLGNIFAGLALQFGKAFKDGDWLFVDNKYAKVIDINWRYTR